MSNKKPTEWTDKIKSSLCHCYNFDFNPLITNITTT